MKLLPKSTLTLPATKSEEIIGNGFAVLLYVAGGSLLKFKTGKPLFVPDLPVGFDSTQIQKVTTATYER